MPSEKQYQYLADMFSNIGLVFFGSTVVPTLFLQQPNLPVAIVGFAFAFFMLACRILHFKII